MTEDPSGERKLKRKMEASFSEGAWKMMHKMGYQPGQGLGRNAQGLVKPVEMSKQKGRHGLGLTTKSTDDLSTTGEPYKSRDPKLVWYEDYGEALLNGDKIWHWAHKDLIETTNKLESLLFKPDKIKESLGPPIEEMNEQSQFCSANLVRELLTYKNQLDHINEMVVTQSHERCNPYELIKKGIFMNRAAMKLANIDHLFDGLFSTAAPKEDILYFADVCAGPGGFSEYLLWRRCNCPFTENDFLDEDCDSSQNTSTSSSHNEPNLAAKGFGLTLTGQCDFREADFLAGPPEAFMAHYGPDRDGDITKWSNLASFAEFVAQGSGGIGAHILTADGGFSVSGQNNLQEVLSKQIYLCQCLCALITLRPGGHFLTKLFDVFTEFSVSLIYIMSILFEEVYIVKPVTSRPANSERYLICKNLLSPLKTMAGCLVAPKFIQENLTEDSNSCFKSNFRRKSHKLPGFGRNQSAHQSNNSNLNDNNNSIEVCEIPEDGINKFGQLDLEKSGPVGLVIEYFLQINEKLNRLKSHSNLNLLNEFGITDNKFGDKIDILRLCSMEIMKEDSSFVKFITKMNNEFAEIQCVALSKLLQYVHNPTLVEPKQKELEKLCLTKWHVPQFERTSVAWPIMSVNRSTIIHSLIGDKQKLSTPNILPNDHIPHLRLESFSKIHLNKLEKLRHNRIALVCGTPSLNSNSEKAEPMLVYSRGSKVWDTYFTTNGDQWRRLDQVFPRLKIRLPAGTLVWGQAIHEYSSKFGLRRHVLFIYDVVCIYGKDCRKLPYRSRMELAKRMSKIVNFPNMTASYIRVPPFLFPSDLPEYYSRLPILQCKDSPSPVPMHCYPDGYMFQPHSILLVEHLKDHWDEVLSRTTGKIYYFNCSTAESTFDFPDDQHLHFVDTRYTRIPWTGESNGLSVRDIISRIEAFNST